MLRFAVIWGLLSGILGLTACSPSSSPHSASAPTVRVCWPRDPESLNPVTLPNAYAVQANNLLYQSLLTVDGPTRRHVPWLAADLPAVEHRDSLTFLHYRLHPQATWDNGTPILAQDVVFTLKVLNCPGLPNESLRGLVSFIRDVQTDAADPRRFTLVCRGYAPEYRDNSGEFPILPAYLVDPQARLRSVPLQQLTQADSSVASVAAVQTFQQEFNQAARWRDPRTLRGSGPYQLAGWQAGQQVTFVRKPRWWADGLKPATPALTANPGRIEFHVVPNPATALLALRRGELDVYPNMPGPDFARLKTSDSSSFRFYSPASYRVVVLEMNVQQPALRDARTRQALALLVDYDRLLRATQYGQGQRTTGLISPREKWVYHDSLPLRPYAPAEAATLLQRAGWQRGPDGWRRAGQPLTLRLFYSASDRTYATVALLFQQSARQIGLPVTLHPTEAGQLSELRRNGEFDLSLRTLYGNPFAYDLRPLLHTGSIGSGGANRSRFGNAASDRLLETIYATEDSVSKARLLRRLQTLLYQEVPFTPLFFEPNRLAVSRRFAHVRPSGLEPGYDLPSFTLAPAQP
ncbi:ABC transporter substrate-binding protein [Hymenobacter sp. 15J16-1T3B]|uniref:ABC transporter substrate-binding protein n=1 Tax=Hymenobacter sp. 15J16-1T3B TaxID=2886941 RepID=UPI001D1065A8|nr:ABC transporter substrate-binding protein [Hymenobacter sp. 15J16-1T3B]MCC3159196.1 ABC transporter substrate-binding protein [Hymenobacter sp. 15J16-1T3B]